MSIIYLFTAMKNYFSLVLVITLYLQSCQKKVNEVQLPKTIKTAFSKHVSNAKNVTWEESPRYYFAYFTQNGEKGLAVFRKYDNSWIDTDIALSKKDLTPEQVNILTNYKNQILNPLDDVKVNSDITK